MLDVDYLLRFRINYLKNSSKKAFYPFKSQTLRLRQDISNKNLNNQDQGCNSRSTIIDVRKKRLM